MICKSHAAQRAGAGWYSCDHSGTSISRAVSEPPARRRSYQALSPSSSALQPGTLRRADLPAVIAGRADAARLRPRAWHPLRRLGTWPPKWRTVTPEPMTVRVEVWTLAADEAGIWLINGVGGGWETGIIMADSDMHREVETLLLGHGIPRESWLDLHSTSATEPGAAWPSEPGPQWASWRPKAASITHTYLAAVRPEGCVRDTWPQACPVTVALAEAVDRPPSYKPTDAPVTRDVDVLFHLLRHLKNLMITDDDNAAALGELWQRHLEPFMPVLARMYHRKRTAV